MNTKNKLISMIVGLCCIVSAVGCNESPECTYNEVSCKVVEKEYHASWIQPINSGRFHTYITHPAKYYVYVEYTELGLTYQFNNEELYNEVRRGEEIIMYLKNTPQSDNTVNVALIPCEKMVGEIDSDEFDEGVEVNPERKVK